MADANRRAAYGEWMAPEAERSGEVLKSLRDACDQAKVKAVEQEILT